MDDCGSEAVKAAILCERVISIMNNLRAHPTNGSNTVALVKILSKRRTALENVKRADYNSYAHIVKYYGLKDISTGLHREHFHCGMYW